jgi:hypothetical protein
MSISQKVISIVQYLFEGVGRIFSPTDDEYPLIGVQPFAGEPFKSGAHWY